MNCVVRFGSVCWQPIVSDDRVAAMYTENVAAGSADRRDSASAVLRRSTARIARTAMAPKAGMGAAFLGGPGLSSTGQRRHLAPDHFRRPAGSRMPAFAQSFGGMLSDEQIGALVRGMREEPGLKRIFSVARIRHPTLPGRVATASAASRCTASIVLRATAQLATLREKPGRLWIPVPELSRRPGAAHPCDHWAARLQRSRLAQ